MRNSGSRKPKSWDLDKRSCPWRAKKRREEVASVRFNLQRSPIWSRASQGRLERRAGVQRLDSLVQDDFLNRHFAPNHCFTNDLVRRPAGVPGSCARAGRESDRGAEISARMEWERY